MELLNNNLSKQKVPDPRGLTSKFYQMAKEEITSIHDNLFQNIEAIYRKYFLTQVRRRK